MRRFSTFVFIGAALAYAPRVKRQNGPVDPSTSPDCTWYDTALDKTFDCDYFESMWALKHEQFVSYNPSVKNDCSGIVVGNSYCVEVNYGTPLPTSTTAEPTGTNTPKPAPTQDGLIDTCITFYKATTGDSCQKIVDEYGTFTFDDFVTWNPAVGEDCAGIWAQYYYCVGVPGTPTTPLPTSTTTPTPSGPSPTQDGVVENCTAFYQATTGDTCEKIVANYGTFTQEELIAWNPALGVDCSGIWAQYYYCVGVPGTPTTRPTTSTTATASSGPSPTQTGIIDTCTTYQQANRGDTCAGIANEHGTFTVDQFLEWNPAVGSDCSGLQIGYYYCVGVPGTPTTRPTTSTTATTSSGPSPTQTGIIDTCTTYQQANRGDTCAGIAKEHGTFTLDEFLKWNPDVGSDCSGLQIGYYYCVGIPGTPTEPPKTTTTTTKPGCTSAPTPTQPGALCSCKKWHKVVSGNTCDSIRKKYGISDADFNKWNPEVGTDCSTLWLGYNVCVGM